MIWLFIVALIAGIDTGIQLVQARQTTEQETP